VLAFASRERWSRWLELEHADARGIWLKLAKKGNAQPSVSQSEAIEVALCWGWIDGQIQRFDEAWYLTRFTPRTPRSRWSQRNRALAEQLIARGAMRASGLAAIEAAKADGRWEAAYASQSSATVPDDLQRALDANPAAAAFFEALDSSNRYAFLYRLHHTAHARRAARIADYLALLDRGETLHER
jgi:uncharacterized protein YdeI (YjbR/CyaY-like superfamily)